MNNTHKNILVVDDEKLLGDILVTILEDEGYQVDYAENGIEALEFLKSKKYDLMATDLFMPVMNGFELIKECQKSFPMTKIIMFSGGGDDLQAEHGQKHVKYKNQNITVDLFMKKPWSMKELLPKLENILNN